MDPRRSGQDVLRCDLCENPGPSMYCDVCHINLCKACVGEHLSDESIEHRVVPFRKRGSTLTCLKHSPKICELHCQACERPICSLCVSSGDHEQHKKTDILKRFESKKLEIRIDLQELEYHIYPKYQKFASKIPVQKDKVKENSQKLKSKICKQREILHREIDIFIDKQNSRVDEIDSKLLAVLNEKEVEYTVRTAEIKQSIANLKILQDSNDICLVSTYQTTNDIFRRLPTKMTVPLPIWVHVGKNGIHRQFGLVSWSSIETEEQGYILKPISSMSFPEDRTLINVPRIIANTDIQHGLSLRKVSCVDMGQFWTCGIDKFMRLYNYYGELVKTIQTESGIMPRDIAVAKNGNLVYTDPKNSTVNIVKNTYKYVVIRLKEWIPSFICCSSSGDFLVVMDNFDKEQTKIVRYSGSKEKQTIQFDAQGNCLYITAVNCNFNTTKYIVENKNLDICVADVHDNAIIVVNCAGELRFRYKGIYKPFSIATDSQGRILAVETAASRIHILDQDGQFLRYIDNCGLMTPWSLSVDIDDRLVVMMRDSGNVKKIQYCL